ncbi:SHOCT domain-containing protein [Stenotrophomonas sp. MMGLT7]|uniref:SHOCT domain-containing protein n=1 Tax=Stenotrophomonas sp. MMGLT7 TaxID=2901227 RepID=UPI001E39681D|nr:SHOCT domain-containing protein [Stenotrophomonas sp. MMGLT7]MCD7099016.1 SHOCT domain-containing protein [Stenotrophomonas sp. MMGLT7]
MGGFSLWHWLVLVLFLVVPLVLIGGLVWLVVHLSRRKPAPVPYVAGALAEGTDVCLERLHVLLEQGQITRDEYERQRAAIIASV